MQRPISNQVQTFVSHLNPGRMSPPFRSRELHLSSHSNLSRSQDMQLNSIQVPSQHHSFPEICVSPQSRLLDSCHLSIQIASLLNPAPYICIWTATRWCFTSIPASPNCISSPLRHYLKNVQVSICASNLHPGPAKRNSGHKTFVLPSSMNHLLQSP